MWFRNAFFMHHIDERKLSEFDMKYVYIRTDIFKPICVLHPIQKQKIDSIKNV